MFMKDIIPVRPKTCKHCGRQLKANNRSGYCTGCSRDKKLKLI
jgi:hypothetical protein